MRLCANLRKVNIWTSVIRLSRTAWCRALIILPSLPARVTEITFTAKGLKTTKCFLGCPAGNELALPFLQKLDWAQMESSVQHITALKTLTLRFPGWPLSPGLKAVVLKEFTWGFRRLVTIQFG